MPRPPATKRYGQIMEVPPRPPLRVVPAALQVKASLFRADHPLREALERFNLKQVPASAGQLRNAVLALRPDPERPGQWSWDDARHYRTVHEYICKAAATGLQN